MEPSRDDPEAEDRVLMADLAAGHDSAMSALMGRWKDRLSGFLFRMIGDHATAQDLAQETFVRVYRYRNAYNPRHSFSTWVFTIAANLARNHRRWASRHPEALTDPADLAAASPESNALAPSLQVAAREDLTAVANAVGDLPQRLRETLVLSVYEHLSHEEIAAITDSTAKAVEARLYRARKLLRAALSSRLP